MPREKKIICNLCKAVPRSGTDIYCLPCRTKYAKDYYQRSKRLKLLALQLIPMLLELNRVIEEQQVSSDYLKYQIHKLVAAIPSDFVSEHDSNS